MARVLERRADGRAHRGDHRVRRLRAGASWPGRTWTVDAAMDDVARR